MKFTYNINAKSEAEAIAACMESYSKSWELRGKEQGAGIPIISEIEKVKGINAATSLYRIAGTLE